MIMESTREVEGLPDGTFSTVIVYEYVCCPSDVDVFEIGGEDE
jgi:hypothetical protein